VYNDAKFINAGTLAYYCNTNEALLTGPVRGYVLEFPGLGGYSCMGGSMDMGVCESRLARVMAEHGVLWIYPFPGPWSWMNRGAVRMIDAIVDAVRERHGLDTSAPWVVSGGSMGGMGALIYAVDSRHAPSACLAVCPGVDLPGCFDVAPDFPRTLVRAVSDYDMPLEDALKRLSPIDRVADMPRIPYMLVNDCADELFPEAQLDDYAAKLTAAGHSVIYDKLAGCSHGEITPDEWERMLRFMLDMTVGGGRMALK